MDWEASDRVCGNRLKAALPHLVESMERHGHLQLNSVVRERLLTASASTLDRLLKPILSTAGSCRRRASEAHGTPVASTDLQRLETGPHRATWRSTWCPLRRSSLRFLHSHSLVATDICAGWTEAVPLLPRSQSLGHPTSRNFRAIRSQPGSEWRGSCRHCQVLAIWGSWWVAPRRQP